MSNVKNIDTLFSLLDEWRHLPAYELERRVDIFFALFLPDVLSTHFDVELHPMIIPEFPLRRGTLKGESVKSPNKSKRVDYVLFTENLQKMFLIELKTDIGSRKNEQDNYLEQARKAGFQNLIHGVICIYKNTKKRYIPKYNHLLDRLSELGFIKIEGKEAIYKVRNTVDGDGPEIKIVYIQPTNKGNNPDVIDFEYFANRIEGTGEMGERFAESLGKWKEPAGSEKDS